MRYRWHLRWATWSPFLRFFFYQCTVPLWKRSLQEEVQNSSTISANVSLLLLQAIFCSFCSVFSWRSNIEHVTVTKWHKHGHRHAAITASSRDCSQYSDVYNLVRIQLCRLFSVVYSTQMEVILIHYAVYVCVRLNSLYICTTCVERSNRTSLRRVHTTML